MTKFKTAIVLLFLIFSLSNAETAEVIKPLQIFFVGGFNGKLVEMNKDLSLTPSLNWRIPAVINALKNDETDTAVCSFGDLSNIYEPVSFMFEGRIERDFIEKFDVYGSSISPDDFSVLNASKPDRRAMSCVFSNTEGIGIPNPFVTKSIQKSEERNIYFYNFISPSRCRQLLLDKWCHVSVNHFSRAFKMLNVSPSKNDITISTVYGDKNEVEELAKLFSKKRGIHFLAQIPPQGEKADYPFTDPVKNGNVYMFSFDNCLKRLPMVKITFKNFGEPRVSLRMLPLEKWDKGNSDEMFKVVEKEIRSEIFKPLRVISAKEKATTSANYITKEAHAEMIKNSVRCDVACVVEMSQAHFSENVINIGNILTTLANDRIYRLRLTGKELRNAIIELIDEYGSREISFSGCSFRYFAGEIKDLRVGRVPVSDKSVYIVAMPESSIKNSQVLTDVYNKLLPEFEGVFLWNLWKNSLKTSKMANNEIFE